MVQLNISDKRAKAVSQVKVAIVDPNAYSRGMMLDMLRRAGARNILSTEDSSALYRHGEASELDILMVEHDQAGPAALNLIRAVRQGKTPLKRALPIIMIASRAEAKLLAEARQAGIDNFLLRPISVSSIQERLEHALHPTRTFVESRHYVGPCRRSGHGPPDYAGPRRRIGDKANTGEDHKDMELLRPVFLRLAELASNEADKPTAELCHLNALLAENIDLLAMQGDPGIVQVYYSARRYLQGIGASGDGHMEVLSRHFRFAIDYIAANPATRQRLSAQIEELERITREDILGRRQRSGKDAQESRFAG